MSDKIVHKELSYVVNGCIFDVHNAVGPGIREECYQKSMEARLAEAELGFIAKPATRRELVYRGQVVDTFEPDLVVAEQIILELKAQRDGLCGENFAQLLSYLKFWNLQLGLLVNFAQSEAIIERVPNLPLEIVDAEDYEWIKPLVASEHRPTLRAIRESLLEICRVIGCGYCDTTYRKLVEVELGHRGLTCQAAAMVAPTFHERSLPTSMISPLVVADSVLVEVQAIHDDISATAVRTMQTYLRLTRCPICLIVSFGKTRFSIRGVHP